jgi:DNA-binding MarR family transcriptional regulator
MADTASATAQTSPARPAGETPEVRPSQSLTAVLAGVDGRCNCTASRKATRYLTAFYDKALAPVRLRTTQFSILHRLGLHGPSTITALAQDIAMDRTTLATNLKPLEREGLLLVRPSRTDGRARTVEITQDGITRLEQAIPRWTSAQQQFEGAFGLEDAERLRLALSAVLGTGFDPWAE